MSIQLEQIKHVILGPRCTDPSGWKDRPDFNASEKDIEEFCLHLESCSYHRTLEAKTESGIKKMLQGLDFALVLPPLHLEPFLANYKNPARWNQWKEEWEKKHPAERINLKGIKLTGEDLKGLDLSRTNLNRSDLSDTNLQEVNFNNSDLRKAKLAGANLRKVTFRSSDLRQIDFSRARICESDFYQAMADGAILAHTELIKTNLSVAYFRSADFSMATFTDVNLSGTFMEDANLRGADLGKENVASAVLTGAILEGANLEETVLSKINSIRLLNHDSSVYLETAPPETRAAIMRGLAMLSESALSVRFENEPLISTTDTLLRVSHYETVGGHRTRYFWQRNSEGNEIILLDVDHQAPYKPNRSLKKLLRSPIKLLRSPKKLVRIGRRTALVALSAFAGFLLALGTMMPQDLVEGWYGNPSFVLQQSSNALRIDASHAFGYQNFRKIFTEPRDLSVDPVLVAEIKTITSFPINLRLDLCDMEGHCTNAIPVLQEVRPGTDFQEYRFDFTGKFKQHYNLRGEVEEAIVDSTSIMEAVFFTNPGRTFTGEFFIRLLEL